MGMEITDGTTPHGELSLHTNYLQRTLIRSVDKTRGKKNKKCQLFWDAMTQLNLPIVAILKILQIYKIHKGQCLSSAFLLETY